MVADVVAAAVVAVVVVIRFAEPCGVVAPRMNFPLYKTLKFTCDSKKMKKINLQKDLFTGAWRVNVRCSRDLELMF